MTLMHKRVSRRTNAAYAILYAKTLEFREFGHRSRWYLAVETAFRHAVHLQARADAAAKPARKGGAR